MSGKAVYNDVVEGARTKDETDKIAKKRLREHTRHELTAHYDGPGNVEVSPEWTMTVTGTGTALDHTYHIDSVHHEWGDHGYTMKITAKNTSKGRKSDAEGGAGAGGSESEAQAAPAAPAERTPQSSINGAITGGGRA